MLWWGPFTCLCPPWAHLFPRALKGAILWVLTMTQQVGDGGGKSGGRHSVDTFRKQLSGEVISCKSENADAPGGLRHRTAPCQPEAVAVAGTQRLCHFLPSDWPSVHLFRPLATGWMRGGEVESVLWTSLPSSLSATCPLATSQRPSSSRSVKGTEHSDQEGAAT